MVKIKFIPAPLIRPPWLHDALSTPLLINFEKVFSFCMILFQNASLLRRRVILGEKLLWNFPVALKRHFNYIIWAHTEQSLSTGIYRFILLR